MYKDGYQSSGNVPVVYEWCRARDFSVKSKAKKISIGGHVNLYYSLLPSLRTPEEFGGKLEKRR